MRICAVILLIVFSFASLACGPKLQPPLQGEWSNFHNDKDRVSKNARSEAQSPSAER